MRYLVFISLFVLPLICFSQSNEIYALTFGDISNFSITTSLGHTKPQKIYIIDTTQPGGTVNFWLPELDNKTPELIQSWERDEHHPYNHSYLFKDPALDKLIDNNEKKHLRKISSSLAPRKISLKGKNYTTVSSSKKIKGFYFVVSEPVLTTDKKYAFIGMTVFHKDSLYQHINETYFGTIQIVFEKQGNNTWKKIKVRNYLIL